MRGLIGYADNVKNQSLLDMEYENVSYEWTERIKSEVTKLSTMLFYRKPHSIQISPFLSSQFTDDNYIR